jgi:FkbM family methyltransferase
MGRLGFALSWAKAIKDRTNGRFVPSVSRVKAALSKLAHDAQFAYFVPDSSWRAIIRSVNVERFAPDFRYDAKTDRLRSDRLGFSFSREQTDMLVHYETHLARRNVIVQKCPTTFRSADDGLTIMTIDGTSIRIDTPETYGILGEVFVQRDYDITPKTPVVVWDIGMNVGAASLRLSSVEQVKKVVAFEPFPGTFEEATRNIALNPGAAAKIRAVQKGVAGRSGTTTAYYSRDYSPGNTTSDPERKRTERDQKIEISLMSAVSALDLVKAEAPGLPIVMKLDAEGAEYEILGSLDSAGRLSEISAIALEFHDGPQQLLPWLERAGFEIDKEGVGQYGFVRAAKPPLAGVFDNPNGPSGS